MSSGSSLILSFGFGLQHFLNFLPLPHGQGSFWPIFSEAKSGVTPNEHDQQTRVPRPSVFIAGRVPHSSQISIFPAFGFLNPYILSHHFENLFLLLFQLLINP
jgi:hypothetical protein